MAYVSLCVIFYSAAKKERPVIFHSQGHSSSTESHLSSLIPVEIPAPVLEVFEVSANEIGAIYNSPNLQQFLMKNSQSWKHLCHTNSSSDLNFRPAQFREDNLSFLPSFPHVRCCVPRQFHIFTFKNRRNLSHNVNRKLSNNCTKLLLIEFRWPNNFCSAKQRHTEAYRDCQPTLPKCYVKSYSFSFIHTVTTAHFSTASYWNTVFCLEVWVLDFYALVSSPSV